MPFPRADEVVQMAVRTESGGFASTSLPDIQDWQARSHSFDAFVAISVAILLALSSLIASYLPARRAAHIDPVVALRTE